MRKRGVCDEDGVNEKRGGEGKREEEREGNMVEGVSIFIHVRLSVFTAGIEGTMQSVNVSVSILALHKTSDVSGSKNVC